MPVRKVVLYKNGMGYFEHLGEVRDKQELELALPSTQLNDVLKSLTVIDLNRGQVSGVTYDSTAPLDRRLAELPVRADAAQGVLEFLNRVRGTAVEIRTPAGPVAGKLMGAELRRKQVGEYTVREAIMEGGSVRLRPILMTKATTILGLVPIALGHGEGAELMQPLAVTVIGGLTVSTLLTLVVVPVLYTYVHRDRMPAKAA